MDTKRTVCYLLFRLLLPVTLLAACVFRINLLSLVYGLLLLVAPLIQSPSRSTMQGSTKHYLIVVLSFSVIAVVAQICFQIYLGAGMSPYGSEFTNCSTKEQIAREVGFQRYDTASLVNIFRLVTPDVGMLIISAIVFGISKGLLPQQESQSELPTISRQPSTSRSHTILGYLGEFLMVLFLAASGIALPSILNGIYFLTFLGIATWWSFYRSLGRVFAYLRCILLVYTGLHMTVLYLSQFQTFQQKVPYENLFARIFGVSPIIQTNCDRPWEINFHPNVNWPHFANLGVILVLYYILAFETRRWCHKPMNFVHVKQSSRYVYKGPCDEVSSASLSQNEAGSMTVVSGFGDDVTGSPSLGSPSLLAPPKRTKRRKRSDERQSLIDEAERGKTYSSIEERSEGAGTATADDVESEGEHTVDGTVKKSYEKRSPVVSVFVFLMKQSYVCSLIVMMVWSITYHSWLTFVFLLGACLIWMYPRSRDLYLTLSPVVLFYAIGLLIIQYVYGMNLSEEELPTEANGYKFAQIGLVKYDPYPMACLHLALKCVFTVMFWLTLRQSMRERQMRRDDAYMHGLALEPVDNNGHGPNNTQATISEAVRQQHDVIDGYDGVRVKQIGGWMWDVLSKYWIIACGLMLLLMALQDVVIYRIIYMIFFLYFILTFQLCYGFWRMSMKVFWWVLIVYSMFILCIVYTYQFDQFPQYWHNSTGLSMEVLSDIGLSTLDTGTLFLQLLTPTAFIIVVIIQVHYFHIPFLNMSAIDRYRASDTNPVGETVVDTEPAGPSDGTKAEEEEEEHVDSPDACHDQPKTKKSWSAKLLAWWMKIWSKLNFSFDILSDLLWRVIDVHILKIVAFTILMVSIAEICALNFVFVVFLIVLLPVPKLNAALPHFVQIWAGIVILAKMIYQLSIVKRDYWYSNCTSVSYDQGIPPPFNSTANNANWFGLVKTDNISHYLRNHIALVALIIFQAIVKVHQAQYYMRPNKTPPETKYPGKIFPEIRRQHADEGLLNCAKFLLNFGFYKYGLELCYTMTVITICVRQDAFAVLYGLLLGILLLLNRRASYILWPIYAIFLAILIPIQYLSCLGFPLVLCWGYPWDEVAEFKRNLAWWMFLPDYIHPPDHNKLVVDFFQLLFVVLQWRVFTIENSSRSVEEYGGGDNKSIMKDVLTNAPNPVKDFTSNKESYLDYIKSVLFFYGFWVTLAIIFITGTSRISVFCMGYLIACFLFLWYGQEMLVKPLRNVLRMWDVLLGYNFIVILLKAALQLVACVYVENLIVNQCWLVQLLSLVCLKVDTYPETDVNQSGDCKLPNDDAGLTWDVVCFVFLLAQRRIYTSQYFRHVVTELEVQNKLASRGAELINLKLIEAVLMINKREESVLANIKRKMTRIKLKQEAMQQKAVMEPTDHYIAIRGGDYYMFEDDSDTDDDDDESVNIADIRHDKPKSKDKDGQPKNPLQILNTAVEEGMDKAIETSDDPADQSKGENESHDITLTDEVEAEPKQGPCTKILNGFKLIWALIASGIDQVTGLLNKISKDNRDVAEILEDEKRKEKERIHHRELQRHASGDPSLHPNQPAADFSINSVGTEEQDKRQPDEHDDTDRLVVVIEDDIHEPTTSDDDHDETASEKFEKTQPRIFQLLLALFNALIAKSELVCYFVMILNHLVTASLLSLLYPMVVFLWATLSVPRPSKMFWISTITYTEAIVVVKYLFQFGFFPWNNGAIHEGPFWPPRIIGIEKNDNYAAMDLVLLLVLFIHRSILKRYGLWKDAQDIEEDMKKAGEMSQPNTPVAPKPNPLTSSNEDLSGTSNSHSLESGLEVSQQDDICPQKKESATDFITTSVEKLVSQLSQCAESIDGLIQQYSDRPFRRIFRPFIEFYEAIQDPTYSAVTDVYAAMFLCDFITFLIIVFGYSAFGPPTTSTNADVTTVINENRVPVPFLVMLIVQFGLIIVDRALYLRKQVFAKFIFQIICVILVHAWMFFILPAVTEKRFTDNVPAQLWYFTKCVYLGLSSYQIRSGYPTRILGNFLTKSYGYINLILFKGFLLIPFLLELRALMDWMWTDTTLALTSWLQMEDIYANIFVLKCNRTAEQNYPTPRGTPRKALVKYGFGGLLLFIIIFIIWFPLLLFSFANTVYVPNAPIDVSIQLSIGGFQPLFHMSAQNNFLQQYTPYEFNKLRDTFARDKGAVGFLSSYKPEDTMLAKLNGDSTAVWGVSPPSLEELGETVNPALNPSPVMLDFSIQVTRETKPGVSSATVSNQFSKIMDFSTREKLAKMLNMTANSTTIKEKIEIKDVFPTFLRVPADKEPKAVTSLNNGDYSDIIMSLRQGTFEGLSGDRQWWEVHENITNPSIFPVRLQKGDHNQLLIVLFSDRVAPAAISFLSSYGIVGLYISVVVVIGRFVRLFVTGKSYAIMFEELPNVERVYTLLNNIYMVRESLEFLLEEELFAKLIFLFRSPQTMIKWTKYKQS
ncbi:unnamed protein product [Owenia fusiformis]|uniref:Uncharacterized protein n=1 Tax=Owenia fusiformis TaxID=6347 RepID=A0A8J1URT4_OWEFU|nr:unnamed protein product [Owenia fusiformis]